MVASAAISIHRRARHLGEDIRRRTRPVHPAKKARMNIAGIIRHNGFEKAMGWMFSNS